MPLTRARAFAHDFFRLLDLDPALQDEVAAAIAECFRRYDTGPFENRFIVGAVVEQIIGSTCRALGLQVRNAGARRQAYDLELAPGYGLSVKYTSAEGRSAKVRLTNSQGAVGAWSTGTFFIIAGVGIGYADDGIATGITVPAGDGMSLDVSLERLRGLWGLAPTVARGPVPSWLAMLPTVSHTPGYFLPVPVAGRGVVRVPRLAGDPIALDILQGGHSPRLFENFDWSV